MIKDNIWQRDLLHLSPSTASAIAVRESAGWKHSQTRSLIFQHADGKGKYILSSLKKKQQILRAEKAA